MGMRRREIEGRFDEIVEFAGIGDFIDTQVKRYSSGMQARLGFSVAAHLDPDVLLIDEVLAVGDLSFSAEVLRAAARVQALGCRDRFCVPQYAGDLDAVRSRAVSAAGRAAAQTGSVGDMVTAYVTTRFEQRRRQGRRDRKKDDARRRWPGPDGARTAGDLADPASGCPAPNPICAGPASRCSFIRADGMMVFNGSSMLDGVPPFDLMTGQEWHIQITFRTNLLRGTYAISGHLFEENRRWPAVELGVLGSFVVAETTRAGGVADLEPRYVIHEPAGA
jgi:lipopolysaccharide transport system ATP-binding protein